MEPTEGKPPKKPRRWLWLLTGISVATAGLLMRHSRMNHERQQAFLVAANEAAVLAMPVAIYLGRTWLPNDAMRSWLALPYVWVNVHGQDDAERLLGLAVSCPSRHSIQYDV